MSKFIKFSDGVAIRKDSICCIRKSERVSKYTPEDNHYDLEIYIVGAPSQAFQYKEKKVREQNYETVFHALDSLE